MDSENNNIFEKVILILITLLSVFLTIYVIKMHKDVITLQNRIDSYSENTQTNIENQTAILNRTLGEYIPVIVPENYKIKFEDLKQQISDMKSSLNADTLELATNSYIDFINTTPPWIQDELSQDIIQAKFDIDYYSILKNYDDSKDKNIAIKDLHNFISESQNYKDIVQVIELHNSLVDESIEEYDNEVTALKEKLSQILNNPNIDYNSLYSVANEVSAFVDEPKLNEEKEKLTMYISEASILEQIDNELTSLENSISQPKDPLIIENIFDSYESTLANAANLLDSIKYLSTDKINTKLEKCIKLITQSQVDYLKSQEEKLISEINTKLDTIDKNIDGLKSDSVSFASINIMANELATLSYTSNTLTVINKTDITNKIKNTTNKLRNKENEIAKLNPEKELASIKTYNENSLSLISDTKNRFDNLSGSKTEKSEAKIDMLLDLESIQTNYLYTPIMSLYQTVYQEIYNDMKSEDKYTVAKKSLLVEKKELNEAF